MHYFCSTLAVLLRKPLTIEEENMAVLPEFSRGWGDLGTIDENPEGTDHPLHHKYFKAVDSGHSERRWLFSQRNISDCQQLRGTTPSRAKLTIIVVDGHTPETPLDSTVDST